MLEMYQCHMNLTSVWLQKYLLTFYLFEFGKNTKEDLKTKVWKLKHKFYKSKSKNQRCFTSI